jgi:hypothetical protein
VGSGFQSTVARRSDGSVVAWGDNSLGQCDVPSLPPGLQYAEISVAAWYGPSPWNDIGSNAVARRSDGSVVAWGHTPYVQFDVPALPPGLSFHEVAAEGVSSVAVVGPAPPFTITAFCFGEGAVVPCPCNNTGQPGHGCDNSISTGGALLEGSGQALLSSDTLVFAASNERPTAFSLFWQGGSEIAPRPFGDGVGCMGPPLKRMYFHNAVGGTVTAPQGADLSVSARSAAVGDPIAPGAIRIYHVFYRDPDPVFCPDPLGSTFNVSNGLRVLWGR